jgi:hypothetical protein
MTPASSMMIKIILGQNHQMPSYEWSARLFGHSVASYMTAMKKATDIYVYFQEASRNIIGPKE